MSADFNIDSIDLSGSSDIDGFLTAASSEQGTQHTSSSILSKIAVGQATDFEVSSIEPTGAPGLDAIFNNNPQLLTAASTGSRRKIASMGDLSNFLRLSAETLIHKSDRNLWALKKSDEGSYFIERLFDDNGEPLKG